ncbi:Retrovirus-related Pol polyprotein from transposon TNT 1-94 [Sesamum angolense]|uniref:Retrovirus-related Pol polyprotein from transposon TNT 1-94 n=1 Tax=Sesamum angolense TaxID=2727404 RepID=A0AAE1W1T7_9LAMI|nr:Retrovirus-related Pol polyprotein from transposon TNT 1-94 [Sesamum angolense]
MYHIMNLKSPGEVWKELEIQFMSKSIANKLYLKQKLYGLKMQEGFDLVQHMNVFNKIITYLAHLDVNIEDEEKTMILLCLLPFSYEHLVTTLTYEKETIKVDEITAEHWLTTSRSRRQGKVITEIVYMLRVIRIVDGGRRMRVLKNEFPDLSQGADEKRDDSSKSANVVQNDDSYCSDGDMLSISTNQSGNSGSIYLGDDRCCNIVGVGDVRIKMYDGTVRTLSDIRHIPDLKKNLISLGTLHKNDFIPKADEDRETIRIVKGALTVMKGKITAGNIYKLLGSIVVGGVHSIDSCDDNTKLWHMRLGHLSELGMTELYKRNLLHGVKSCKLDFCKFCVLGKQTKVSFTIGKHKTEGILDYVHSDVWGPTREQSLGGSLYYTTFINDFSRKVWVYVLKQKSEVFAKFKLWKAEVENQTGRKIKYLRSDNGTEYTDSQFQKFCEEHGIHRHFSVRLPKRFWVEAVSMACYLINRSPRASLGGNVAEEAWTGVKGYKFWDSTARKMVISRDAVFDEQSMLQQYQNEMPKVCSSSDTLQMELEPHPVAIENRGRSHLTSGDPVATESDGSSTTNELQAYNLARDRQRRTNVKPPSRLGYEDMVSFALQCSV